VDLNQRYGFLGLFIKSLSIIFLLIYVIEIGLWRFIFTAILVCLFTFLVLGSYYWRYCVQAWVDFRAKAEWSKQAYTTIFLIFLHALLVQTQAFEVIPIKGIVYLGSVLESLEGTWHLAIPNPQPIWMAWFWLGTYLFAFPALLFGTVICLNGRKECSLLRRFFSACNFIAFIALPVFAILGVPEVWIQIPLYQPPVATIGEGLTYYRLLSGPFNCLPSLHCSLALLASFVSLRSGMPVMNWLSPLIGGFVCISTFMAGIHWITDVLISFPLVWCAWYVAEQAESSRAKSV
jgi:hypothetical protein